ncbi:Imm45 family immunity protein [Acinetobacter sp. ESL0695]|uniref:Imm45 family immunity protein n=1 Tax=Acinetobacter sp. ESL0695 TaxID=2983215 RepID=UPI0023F5259B|nr:Imm45 family immunity protein [Acinetobacter sp. ESL0695]WEV49311.1 Imm45 family immunity protein [Acinetobacter sp. ESL0695]
MLTNWVKLTELAGKSFIKGTLLKFSAKYPFESEVVMMICQSPDKSGLCLMTITGYKAGKNCYQKLPDSEVYEDVSAIWLTENWHKWIYPECNVKDVWVHRGLQVCDLI